MAPRPRKLRIKVRVASSEINRISPMMAHMSGNEKVVPVISMVFPFRPLGRISMAGYFFD